MMKTIEMVDLDDMDLDDFLLIATHRRLATPAELDRFATGWREGYENGEPGFGDEKTLYDWVGGLYCWRWLGDILESNGLDRDAEIDWSKVKWVIRTH